MVYHDFLLLPSCFQTLNLNLWNCLSSLFHANPTNLSLKLNEHILKVCFLLCEVITYQCFYHLGYVSAFYFNLRQVLTTWHEVLTSKLGKCWKLNYVISWESYLFLLMLCNNSCLCMSSNIKIWPDGWYGLYYRKSWLTWGGTGIYFRCITIRSCYKSSWEAQWLSQGHEGRNIYIYECIWPIRNLCNAIISFSISSRFIFSSYFPGVQVFISRNWW